MSFLLLQNLIWRAEWSVYCFQLTGKLETLNNFGGTVYFVCPLKLYKGHTEAQRSYVRELPKLRNYMTESLYYGVNQNDRYLIVKTNFRQFKFFVR